MAERPNENFVAVVLLVFAGSLFAQNKALRPARRAKSKMN